jgi:hypothetical protein
MQFTPRHYYFIYVRYRSDKPMRNLEYFIMRDSRFIIGATGMKGALVCLEYDWNWEKEIFW